MAEALSNDHGCEDKCSEDSQYEYINSIIKDEEIRKYFRVDLMYKTRHNEWPKETYLQYKLTLNSKTEHSEQFWFREWSFIKGNRLFSSAEHAEITLLKDMKTVLGFLQRNEVSYMMENLSVSSQDAKARSREDEKMMRMNLKILMNYSPCRVCADKIEEFTKETKKYCETNISITFGTFYKVYTKKDDNIHIEGLAKLRNAGIQLLLVWDSKHLKEIIEKIGKKEEREAREKIDREYMKLMIEKAK